MPERTHRNYGALRKMKGLFFEDGTNIFYKNRKNVYFKVFFLRKKVKTMLKRKISNKIECISF